MRTLFAISKSWMAMVLVPPLVGCLLGYLLVAGDGSQTPVFGDEDAHDADIPRFSDAEIDSILNASFPVYGVGDEFEGLPLVLNRQVKSPPPADLPGMPTNEVTELHQKMNTYFAKPNRCSRLFCSN